MIHHLKIAGLALVAVFAVSAVGASAAQAVEGSLSWESGTTTLDGVQDPTEPSQVFKMTVGALTADTVNISAAVSGTGGTTVTTEALTYTDSKLEAEGKKDVITGPFGTLPKFNMNGCNYTFHAGTTIKEAPSGETEGTMDIVCPAGNEIKIEAPGCNINIPAQDGLGPVYFRTVTTAGGKEHATIEVKVGDGPATHLKAFKYTHSGFLCGSGSAADGTYTGKMTVNGTTASGAITSVTVT